MPMRRTWLLFAAHHTLAAATAVLYCYADARDTAFFGKEVSAEVMCWIGGYLLLPGLIVGGLAHARRLLPPSKPDYLLTLVGPSTGVYLLTLIWIASLYTGPARRPGGIGLVLGLLAFSCNYCTCFGSMWVFGRGWILRRRSVTPPG